MAKAISKFHSWLIIVALLSLNIVEQAASVINATIPGMAKAFPNEKLVNIELITTIVSIFVTVFVLVSGIFVKWIGQKKTAILGLLIASISSVIPAIANNFTIILISRAVLGVGIGLANPLAISLIGVFFYGDQRAKLMGWRSAIAGIGTAVMTFLAGQLLVFGWHAAYWVYLLFIPTLILYIFAVPDPEKSGALKRQEIEQAKEMTEAAKQGNEVKKNPIGLIILLTLLTFFTLISMMVVAVKLPTYFVQAHIGSPTDASNVWSAVNLATVVGGFLFGPIYKRLDKYVLPLGLFLAGLCVIIIPFASSLGMIYVVSMIDGIAGSLIIPYIFNRISEVSSAKKAPLFTSIALVGSNLGSFMAPYAGELLGMGTNAGLAIMNSGIINIILAVVSLAVIFILKKKTLCLKGTNTK